jgi:hypothetical protein
MKRMLRLLASMAPMALALSMVGADDCGFYWPKNDNTNTWSPPACAKGLTSYTCYYSLHGLLTGRSCLVVGLVCASADDQATLLGSEKLDPRVAALSSSYARNTPGSPVTCEVTDPSSPTPTPNEAQCIDATLQGVGGAGTSGVGGSPPATCGNPGDACTYDTDCCSGSCTLNACN